MKRQVISAMLAAGILSSGFTSPANAQGLYIEGAMECGMWIDARNRQLSSLLEYYLMGLLNGLSLAAGVEFWRASGTEISREQAFLWMDKYCRETPLSNPIAGAYVLINERTNFAFRDSIAKLRD